MYIIKIRSTSKCPTTMNLVQSCQNPDTSMLGVFKPYFVLLCPARACDYCSWFGYDSVVNDRESSTSVITVQERHWLTPLSGVHEVFVALETECLCKFVSLVMFVPEEHHLSGAPQAQSSSAYSSSTDQGVFPETLCIEQEVVLSCRFC